MTDHVIIARMMVRAETTVGIMLSSRPEGNKPLCYTLEDGPSPDPSGKKVYARTRIPAGVYRLAKVMPGESGIADAHQRRWGHPFAVAITGVPGFDLIRLHAGNTAKDTKGCPLVGDGVLYAFGPGPKGQAPMLSASRQAYKRVFEETLRYIVERTTEPHIVIYDEGGWGTQFLGQVPLPEPCIKVKDVQRGGEAVLAEVEKAAKAIDSIWEAPGAHTKYRAPALPDDVNAAIRRSMTALTAARKSIPTHYRIHSGAGKIKKSKAKR